jgi:ectoine hydroxylase-related dioxygenase (phytanoyl-CoA dioxygenase family)
VQLYLSQSLMNQYATGWSVAAYSCPVLAQYRQVYMGNQRYLWWIAVTGNEPSMDMLAWFIDPQTNAAGFSPHRDRQPRDSPSTFRSDGSAQLTTCWLPLTDALPENSCLYVLPRAHDPGYFAGAARPISLFVSLFCFALEFKTCTLCHGMCVAA